MRRCSTFLLLIAAVGFCHAQNDGFSAQQDGFVFPGEAARPEKFTTQRPFQPQQPQQPPFQPQQPQRPQQPPFQPQQPQRPQQPPFQPQQPQRPQQPPFQPQQPQRPQQPPFQPQQPQQPPFQPQRPQRPSEQRTTNAPTPAPLPPSTTSSVMDYNACLERCQTTSEYNPLCGSDGQVYSNPGRLNCAVNCGNQVQFVNFGQCRQQ